MIRLFNKLFHKKKFNIFVLGCQRSGTTMLRLILNSHPEIYCYGEINGYSYFEKNINIKHNKKYNAFQLPIWTELFAEYDCIKKYKKKEDKILFIFREPKQTISSMKSLFCYRKDCWFGVDDFNLEKNYINYEVVPNVNIWMEDKSRCFGKLFKKEIKRYKNKECENLIKAICYWKYKNYSYFKMKKMGYKIKLVNYETLVNKPREELINIMNFLEIDYSQEMLFHHIKKHDETYNNFTLGKTDSKRKIDNESIKKWKKNITEQEKQIIDSKTKKMLLRLEKEAESK